jgi:hypothetical protein
MYRDVTGNGMGDEQKDRARDLARRVVARMAPEELVLFDAAADLYAERTRRGSGKRSRSDKALGSGFGDAVALLSPVAMLVAKAVVDRLADKAGDAAADGSARLLKRAARRLFRHSQAAATAPATPPADTSDAPSGDPGLASSADYLEELRRLAQDEARRWGLDEEKARVLVETLLSELGNGQ